MRHMRRLCPFTRAPPPDRHQSRYTLTGSHQVACHPITICLMRFTLSLHAAASVAPAPTGDAGERGGRGADEATEQSGRDDEGHGRGWRGSALRRSGPAARVRCTGCAGGALFLSRALVFRRAVCVWMPTVGV